MKIEYLEIVTPNVDKLCAAAHGIEFSDPVAELGHARVATFADGGRIGIRAPMSETEEPVTRPYFLVDDVEGATKKAEDNGSEIMHPPLEIPGQGTFSICLTDGIQHGFWQK